VSDQARMQASEKWLQKYRATYRAVTIASHQPDTPLLKLILPLLRLSPLLATISDWRHKRSTATLTRAKIPISSMQ
jgi:hypothetical protein